MKYNYDNKRRCEIIGVNCPEKCFGGCVSFEGLTLSQLNKLLDENFIDPKECQNNSPTTMEFKEFLEKYNGATLHGYMITPERSDYRVTIEGLEYCGDVSKEMLFDFIKLFRYADDFTCEEDYLYCWFD